MAMLEKRRQAFKDTKFELNLRTYYFDRSDFNGAEILHLVRTIGVVRRQ